MSKNSIQTMCDVLSEKVGYQGNFAYSDGEILWACNGSLYVQIKMQIPKGCYHLPILSHAITTIGDEWKQKEDDSNLILSSKKLRFKIAKIENEFLDKTEILEEEKDYSDFNVEDLKFISAHAARSNLSSFGQVFFDSKNMFATDNIRLGIVQHNLNVDKTFSIYINTINRILKFNPTKVCIKDNTLYAKNEFEQMYLCCTLNIPGNIVPYEQFLDVQTEFSIKFPDLSPVITDVKIMSIENTDENFIDIFCSKNGLKLIGNFSYGRVERSIPIEMETDRNKSFKVFLKYLDILSNKTLLFKEKPFIQINDGERISIISIKNEE